MSVDTGPVMSVAVDGLSGMAFSASLSGTTLSFTCLAPSGTVVPFSTDAPFVSALVGVQASFSVAGVAPSSFVGGA